ncbi:MAG: hypothetical protein ACRDTE_11045 [Pseudonocardiaceae bacterium]
MDELEDLVEQASTVGWFACPSMITPGWRYRRACCIRNSGVISVESLKEPFHSTTRWSALGLRQGEALGLKWTDIATDWHHGCQEQNPCGRDVKPEDCPKAYVTGSLTVRRALQRQTWQHGCGPTNECGRKRGADCPARHGGGLAIVEPKSRAGRRVVSLPSSLVLALLEHRQTQDNERRMAREVWQDDAWVFAQPNGKPTDPRADYGE